MTNCLYAMLHHLRVTNFALLSDVSIEFGPGFNVLTGETGAGKSLIVEAVNLLRGGRASANIPRTGSKEAIVEAIFEIPTDLHNRVTKLLEQAGLASSEQEVIVRRVIERAGKNQIRSRTYVNGGLTTARLLAELGALLVDLSGQHQHQGLVDPNRHRAILDLFGQANDQVTAMRAAWAKLEQARVAWENLHNTLSPEQLDFLRFQIAELDAARIVDPVEDKKLEQARTTLLSTDQLQTQSRLAEEHAYAGDHSATDKLSNAIRALRAIVDIDSTLQSPLECLEEARNLTEDAARTLSEYANSIDSDPQQLTAVLDRIDLLQKLKRKYGGSLEQVISRHGALRQQLEQLNDKEQAIANMNNVLEIAKREATHLATQLSSIREQAAAKLSCAVQTALADLDMPLARLSVTTTPCSLTANGAETVEYLLASNPGESAKPLAKIASGGELSRIMLALKLVLRRADSVATYVFDEVDAGIGGTTAEAVGKYIHAVARERQVLCVTHLPQIAAFASHHFHVRKHIVAGHTETEVKLLSPRERTEETARMLGGTRITKRARAHASEMLQSARP